MPVIFVSADEHWAAFDEEDSPPEVRKPLIDYINSSLRESRIYIYILLNTYMRFDVIATTTYDAL